jgi:hypothetical protein
MRFRFGAMTAVAFGLCAPGSATAQTPTLETSVTFLVPVKLTQLSPDLEKVRLHCLILADTVLNTYYTPTPAGLPILSPEAWVTSGQVVTTMSLTVYVVSVPPTAIGKESYYQCNIDGYSKSLQKWGFLTETATDAAFRLTPTPMPINGKIVW